LKIPKQNFIQNKFHTIHQYQHFTPKIQKKDYLLHGVIEPKLSLHPLSNCGMITMKGNLTFKILNLDEEYVFQLPSVGAKGLFFGTTVMENMGTSEIVCEKTDYKLTLKWKADRTLSGKIYFKGDKIYKISGSYFDEIQLKSLKKKKKFSILFIQKLGLFKKKIVKEINNQESNESRRVWLEVARLIDDKNYDEATKKKKI